MSDYREFLNVTHGDLEYDVGFHPAWNTLRLNVEDNGYEGGSVEVWLSPEQARELADALIRATDAFQESKP